MTNVFVPLGTPDNSPAIHRWVHGREMCEVPSGTKDRSITDANIVTPQSHFDSRECCLRRWDSDSGVFGRADVREWRSGEHRPLSPLPGLCGRRVISSPTVETVGYFRDVPSGTKRTMP